MCCGTRSKATFGWLNFFCKYSAAGADPVFQGFVNLALACVADPAIPLRKATVLFKRSSEDSQELASLRESLAADFAVRGTRICGRARTRGSNPSSARRLGSPWSMFPRMIDIVPAAERGVARILNTSTMALAS